VVRTRVLGVAVMVMLAVLTACASGPPVDYSHLGADDVVFRFVELRYDPVPPTATFEIPTVTVFGDGRVVRPVPGEGYPWPEVTQQWLTPTGMRRLLDAARDAGLAKQTDFGEVDVVDGGGAVFRVVDRVTVVGAPDMGWTIPRMRVRAFMAQLGNLNRWMGWDLSAEEPYSPPGVAVIAWEQGPETGAEPAWPLSDLGSGVPVRGAVCTVYEVADLAPVRSAVTAQGIQGLLWRSNGMSYWIMVRPLLPGDTGCASTAIEEIIG